MAIHCVKNKNSNTLKFTKPSRFFSLFRPTAVVVNNAVVNDTECPTLFTPLERRRFTGMDAYRIWGIGAGCLSFNIMLP